MSFGRGEAVRELERRAAYLEGRLGEIPIGDGRRPYIRNEVKAIGKALSYMRAPEAIALLIEKEAPVALEIVEYDAHLHRRLRALLKDLAEQIRRGAWRKHASEAIREDWVGEEAP